MLVFFVIPVLYVIAVSVLKWNGISAPSFNGMKNFALLFKDKAFIRSIVNNVIWAFTAACIQVPLAMLMAIILSRKPRGWKFFRTVYFFPQVISGIALAMLWRGIYNADYGLLNGLLKAIGLGHLACDWLGGHHHHRPELLRGGDHRRRVRLPAGDIHHHSAHQEDLSAHLRHACEHYGVASV